MSLGTVLLYGLALYAAVGICIAAAFVTFGMTRVLAEPTTATIGARMLVFPGAAALWPHVLRRWLKAGRRA
jgi:hypothetical protein